jgi:predicted outer membrane repeat protein
MEGGSIVNNEAADLGGGLLVNYGSDATMTGGTISYNKAGTQGGGVAVREESAGIKSSFIMQGGTISYNTAVAGSGGGLLLGGITSVSGLTITIEGGTISNNSAKLSGGGICVTQGLLTIKGGTIAANTAELSGGGVYILNAAGAIKKQASGGIIYGYTPTNPNSNKVTDPALTVKTNKGHAVYLEGGSKKRETTVGIGAALDSSALDNATGGWTE